MSTFDGNIIIGTSVDVGGINTGLNKISNAFRKLSRSTGISGIFADATSAASDLIEVQNIVDVTFEDMAWKAERFANVAIKQFGMSRLAAEQTAGSFMAMGRAMDLDQENASNMAIQLASLTGDFASFYNISQEYARVALSAVYTGETETLKRYGIVLTEANLQQYALTQGIDANVKKMSARDKLILRYMYIMEHTKDMQGDFVRTQGSWANQTRQIKQNWQEFLIVLGNGITTVLSPLLGVINQIIFALTRFMKVVLIIIGNIFHINFDQASDSMSGFADATDDAVEAEEDLEDAVSGAGKAAKKALQPFDELNVLTSKQGGGAGGTVDIFEDFEIPDPTADWLGDLEEKLHSAIDNLYDFGKFLSDTFAGLLDRIDWDKVYEKARNFGTGLAQFLNGLIQPSTFASVAKTIAGALNTAIYAALSFGKEFDWKNLGNSIATGLNKFVATFDWKAFAETINTFVHGIMDTIKTFIDETDWEALFKGIKDFFTSLDIDTVAILLGFTAFMGLISGFFFKVLRKFIRNQFIMNFIQALTGIDLASILSASNIGTVLGTALRRFITFIFSTALSPSFWIASFVALGPRILTGLSMMLARLTGVEGVTILGTSLAEFFEAGFASMMSEMTLGQQFVFVIRTAFRLIIEIIRAAWPQVVAAFESIAPVLTTIAGWFSLITGAVMALVSWVSMLIDGFSWLKEILMVVGIALAVVGAIILGASTWPAIIVGAVVAVVATLVVLIKDNWEAIKEFFSKIGTAIKDFFEMLVIKVKAMIAKIKSVVMPIFLNIKNKVTEFVSGVIEKIKTIVTAIATFLAPAIEFISKVIYGVTIIVKAVFIIIGQYIQAFFEKVKGYIAVAIATVKAFISAIIKIAQALIEKALEIVTIAWGYIKDFFAKVVSIATTVWNKIVEIVTAIKDKAVEIITAVWEKITEVVTTVVEFLREKYDAIVAKIKELYETYLAPYVEKIRTKVSEVTEAIRSKLHELWEKITTKIREIYEQHILPKLELVKTKLEEFKNWVKEHILDWIAEKVSALWNGIVSGAVGLANGIIGVVEKMLNAIINKLNEWIGGFNGVVRAAAAITGDSWSDISLFNEVHLERIPIPALAKGAVIPPNAPFLAMLGDQKNGTNIEAPLDTIKQALQEALASSGFGGNGDITVNCLLDGKAIARAVVKQNDIYKKSTGRSLI